MHQMSYYHLILCYPGLRQYINRCHIGNLTMELFDFLVALETDREL